MFEPWEEDIPDLNHLQALDMVEYVPLDKLLQTDQKLNCHRKASPRDLALAAQFMGQSNRTEQLVLLPATHTITKFRSGSIRGTTRQCFPETRREKWNPTHFHIPDRAFIIRTGRFYHACQLSGRGPGALLICLLFPHPQCVRTGALFYSWLVRVFFRMPSNLIKANCTGTAAAASGGGPDWRGAGNIMTL